MTWAIIWLALAWITGLASVIYFRRRFSPSQNQNRLDEEPAPEFSYSGMFWVRSRPQALVALFGLGFLAALGFGIYYPPPIYSSPSILASHFFLTGEIVVSDLSGKDVREYSVNDGDEFKNAMTQIRESDQPVYGLHLRVPVMNLNDLEKISSLRSLDLDSTLVDDLAPIKNLVSLTALDLGKTPFYELAQIEFFPNLKWLDLSQTKIADFIYLSNLRHIQILDLEDTQIADLTPLEKLQDLRRLNLAGTKVVDLNPLSNLVNIEQLNLASTRIVDLSPLYSLVSLKKIDLSRTPIKPDQVEKLRKNLAQKGNHSVEIVAPLE